MANLCADCGSEFIFSDEEMSYYQRISPKFQESVFSLPAPIHCLECRTRRRCAFRNQRVLHKRQCDCCGRPHVTLYSPESTTPVYCLQCFWGESWDASEYGMALQLNTPFMAQLSELNLRVPRLSVMNQLGENSEYCNYSYSNKNCYLVFSSHYEEDCLYGNCSTKNKDCIDYHWLGNSELCCEAMFSSECYNCIYINHCSGCRDCLFSTDLQGCSNCFLSANLRHKEFHILNQAYSETEYFQKLAEYNLQSYQGFVAAKALYLEKVRKEFPVRATHQVQCENCGGSNLQKSKNLVNCFEATNCEDVINGSYMAQTVDSIEVNYSGWDRCELCYESIGITDLFHGICCDSCWHGGELIYCSYCFSCSNCFGCISLQNKEYCILNKQYSKAEYERLVPLIIAGMQANGDWGRFFPADFSLFSYDETVAQDWFPLEEDAARKLGFYRRQRNERQYQAQSYEIPDNIAEVPSSISSELLLCSECRRNYKIAAAEHELYQRLGVPIARNCVDCRQKNRLALHSGWQLFERPCSTCRKNIQSVYDVQCQESVLCEDCYLKEVYGI